MSDKRHHQQMTKPHSGIAANGHSCQSVRNTGRKSPSPNTKISAGGIQANAKTADANNSNSAHVLRRSNRDSGVEFGFMAMLLQDAIGGMYSSCDLSQGLRPLSP